jgi:hypothetical protein
LGTLNLCHRAGHYSESDLARVRLVAQLAVPALLAMGGSAHTGGPVV